MEKGISRPPSQELEEALKEQQRRQLIAPEAGEIALTSSVEVTDNPRLHVEISTGVMTGREILDALDQELGSEMPEDQKRAIKHDVVTGMASIAHRRLRQGLGNHALKSLRRRQMIAAQTVRTQGVRSAHQSGKSKKP